MGFNFQIEGAVSVWSGRFTTIWGTLLDGTMQQRDHISLPTKDGSRLITTILDIGVGQNMHKGPVTGRCEFVTMRTWGPVINPEKIQLMGIAIRSDVAPYMRNEPYGETLEQ